MSPRWRSKSPGEKEQTIWSRRQDSNPRPAVYKTAALPLSYAGKATRRGYRTVSLSAKWMMGKRLGLAAVALLDEANAAIRINRKAIARRNLVQG